MKTKQKKIYKFVNKYFKNGVDVTIIKGSYRTGNNSLELIEHETGEPFLIASTNLEFPLKNDQVMIKNYSENEGVKEFLLENNIIDEQIKSIDLGFVKVTIHEFTDEFLENNI